MVFHGIALDGLEQLAHNDCLKGNNTNVCFMYIYDHHFVNISSSCRRIALYTVASVLYCIISDVKITYSLSSNIKIKPSYGTQNGTDACFLSCFTFLQDFD